MVYISGICTTAVYTTYVFTSIVHSRAIRSRQEIHRFHQPLPPVSLALMVSMRVRTSLSALSSSICLALHSAIARFSKVSARPTETFFYRNKAREATEDVAYLGLPLLVQSPFSDAEIGLFARLRHQLYRPTIPNRCAFVVHFCLVSNPPAFAQANFQAPGRSLSVEVGQNRVATIKNLFCQ